MLISVHIPKTGGTAFGLLLQRHFGSALLRDYGDRPLTHGPLVRIGSALARALVAPARVRDHAAVHGHFLPLKYALVRGDLVTWLREPAQRIVSRYQHYLRDLEEGRPLQFAAGVRPGMSLADFVEIPRFQDTYAKYFRGCPVSRVRCFGFSEDMDEGLERMRRQLGLDLGEPVRARANPSKQGAEYAIDAPLRRRIERLNRADYRIWHWACDRDRA